MNDIIYTSPSGAEFKAQNRIWEDTFTHAANAFPSANGEGDYYQDLGLFSSQLKARFEFKTDNEAVTFYNALRERGAGTIAEPDTTRIRTVQPLQINKTHGLVRDVKRIIFTVDFVESLVNGQIESSQNLKSKNNELSERALNISSNEFAQSQNLRDAASQEKQKQNFTKTLSNINTRLGIATTQLESRIDAIVSDPVNIIIDAKRLIEQPGISFNRIKNKIQGYANLLQDLLTPLDSISLLQNRNTAYYNQAQGANTLNAMAGALVDGSYNSASEALESAKIVSDNYLIYRDYLDNLESQGTFNQDGAIQQSLEVLIYDSLSLLFDISFGLRKEFKFITQEQTNIFEIALQYYKNEWIENEQAIFDFIQDTNGGRDKLFYSPGTEVTVYV